MTETERTRYIKNSHGKFIPTNLVSNLSELKAYLKGYSGGGEPPESYGKNTRRANLYRYGDAVCAEQKKLKSYDGGKTFLAPKLKEPKPMRESEIRDLEDNVTLLTQQVGRTNPSFIPRWAFSYIPEGDMQPNYDFSRSCN